MAEVHDDLDGPARAARRLGVRLGSIEERIRRQGREDLRRLLDEGAA